MTTHQITISIDEQLLDHYTDQHLAALWHVAQANPAEHGDKNAGAIAEKIGRAIIKRFLQAQPPALYTHQGDDHSRLALSRMARWNGTEWVPVEGIQADVVDIRQPYARRSDATSSSASACNTRASTDSSPNTFATTSGATSGPNTDSQIDLAVTSRSYATTAASISTSGVDAL